MSEGTRLVIKENTIPAGIAAYSKAIMKTTKQTALPKVALQALNWIVNGSPNEAVTPPILEGTLRGSGGVFVGNRFIGSAKQYEGTPATSGNFPDNVIGIVFNTSYAARLHDYPFNPGPASRRAGNVGYKYIEKHLKADGKDLTKMYALLLKKETN